MRKAFFFKLIRKRIAPALLAALFVLPLASCHGAKVLDEFVIPDTFDESKEYTVTFWAKNDTNKTQTKIYEKAISDFQELYPNIKVVLRLYTDYGKIYNDVITNIATRTTPNVCITYPDHIATYLSGKNVVVPLDSLFDDERYGLGGSELKFDSPKKEELVPKFLEECLFADHYYAIPYMRSTEACYVNKTFVEKLGFTLPDVLTWDFVWQVADAAAEKDGDGNYKVNSQKVMKPFIYKSTDNMMIQHAKQTDTPFSTSDGDILLFNEKTKSFLETVALHASRGSFTTFKISSYPANFLNAGQCIFAIDSTAGSTWMGSKAPLSDISADKIIDFETAVMTVPQENADEPRMISQGPSVCIFNKADPETVLASWLFAQYLLTNDVQIAYSQTEGYVPVTLKAQNSKEYQDYINHEPEEGSLYYEVKLKAVRLLIDNIDNTFVTPVFNGSASLRDASGQLIENTVKSVNRKEKVDDAYYEKLFKDVSSLYRLDSIRSASSVPSSEDARELPAASVALLCALAVIWIVLGVYSLTAYLKAKKSKK